MADPLELSLQRLRLGTRLNVVRPTIPAAREENRAPVGKIDDPRVFCGFVQL